MSIEQTLTSDTSGTVKLDVNALEPIIIMYSDTEVSVEADLGDIKSVLEVIDPLMASSEEDSIELPDTFDGAIRLTLSAPTTDAVSLSLGITEAINIDGVLEDSMMDIDIAPSPNLLVFSANATDIEVSVDLNTTSIIFEDLTSTTPEVLQITTAGINANISMDETGDIVIRDTGISESLLVKMAESETALATADPVLLLSLSEFDATISSDLSSVDFETDFNMALTMSLLDQEAGLGIGATANTQVSMIPTESGSVVPSVDAGSLTLIGAAETGLSSVTATTGECLADISGETGFFLYEVTTCPTLP